MTTNDRPQALPDWSRVRRLLVVRPGHLGDVVLTGPALRAIKAHCPDIHLTLLTSPGGAPAAALLPWVDEVRTHRALWQDLGEPAQGSAHERALIEDLRAGAHDAALILTSFSQSPHPAALACALAGIPVRIGASREHGQTLTFTMPAAPDPLHQVERNLRLVEAVGVPVTDRRLELRVPDAARAAVHELLAAADLTGPYVVLSPFASARARTFEPARFVLAARLLSEQTGLKIALCGRESDRARAQPLAAVLGAHGLNLVGATDLPAFAALLAGARLLLTNNSAALHLADALAVPQLVMYAGTDLESQWAPRVSPHLLLRRETPCSPCHRLECPYHHECLAFSPRDVTKAALRVLRSR